MAWSLINGTRYYYRSRYVDGVVKTTYYGKGLGARLAEQADTVERIRQASMEESDRHHIHSVSQQISQISKTIDWVDTLTRADAFACGFHRYRRGSDWRLRSCNI